MRDFLMLVLIAIIVFYNFCGIISMQNKLNNIQHTADMLADEMVISNESILTEIYRYEGA